MVHCGYKKNQIKGGAEMGMNSASDILMSIGSMMQKPAVNTKDNKLPSDKDTFKDAIKKEFDKTKETCNPEKPQNNTTKDKPLEKEQSSNKVGEEVLEEAALLVQNPQMQMWNDDMIATLLQNGNDVSQTMTTLLQNVPKEVPIAQVQTTTPVDTMLTQQTKLPDAQMLQTTNGKVETQKANGNKQDFDVLQVIKNDVQIQKPVENTSGKQLQQNTNGKEQFVQQDFKNLEVVSETEIKTEETQKPIHEMMLQTKQKTAEGEEVVHVKVADVLPVTKENVTQQLADKILMRSSNEFELQLNPESLGKIQIKVQFDKRETKVTILCESAKALHLLSENSSSLAALLENRTGNSTTIQMHENKDAFYKQDTDQNGHQQQQQTKDEQQQRHQKQKQRDAMDFLQQMRLGLV